MVRRRSPLLCLVLILLTAPVASALTGFDPAGQGMAYPDLANGRRTPLPAVQALALGSETIEVDGRLDDPAWQRAEAATGFRQADPNRGALPTEETVFKVAYDEDNLYFAVACYENDVTQTSSSLARRDKIDNSDVVSIYIDPYHDRTTGYNFRVNPDGVLADAYMFNDGNRDWDWDAVWDAETWSDSEGWYAEFRIPFSSIRYNPASDVWGLQVYRWMHGRGEDNGWVHWEREQNGFISRFGELRGMYGLSAPRQFEVVPYIVQRSTDPSAGPAEDDLDAFSNFGADVKYGLTADLTLTATFQPDFGQVEADPATLNLSPFETFFSEKRPFFVEGARFFEHPDFNLVYSRRIGTGNENSRIRYAGKLIGKAAGDISVATLFAATDVTQDGQAHNFLKNGDNQAYFAVGRFGKEFAEGNHRINFMQTAVWRDEGTRLDLDSNPRASRDGYSTGVDFDLNFDDRTWNVQGSWVGTVVDDAPVASEPEVPHAARYGTGAALDLRKVSGRYRGGMGGRWEGDELDPNDMGILFAPDEIGSYGWLQRRFDNDGKEDPYIVQGNVNLNYSQSWLYAGRDLRDADDPSQVLWTYDRGHRQSTNMNINGWMENKHRWSVWYGVWHNRNRTDKYATRFFEGVRGPLMTIPDATGGWLGFNSDWRKTFKVDSEINLGFGEGGAREFSWRAGINWVQSSRINHSIRIGFSDDHSEAQWVGNFANPGGGIGDVSYVFGQLDRQTLDLTLRSNVLFSKDQSLELYLQPFLTVGDYADARELAAPDTYRFDPYTQDNYDITQNDFRFGAVNLNAVYRWEYRPGSALFVVWTHSRNKYDERSFHGNNPSRFANDFSSDPLFRNEPENTLLAKLTYWFSL